LAAGLAYVAADLLTGNAILPTLLLTAGNMVGPLVGSYLFGRISESHRRLAEPASVSYTLAIAIAASGAAGLVGLIAGPIVISSTPIQGWVYWFTAELVNFVIVLPFALSWPVSGFDKFKVPSERITLGNVMPIAIFVMSVGFAYWLGGSKSFAFTVPVLLWAATTYDKFTTATLTLFASAAALGQIDPSLPSRSEVLLLRVEVALMALAPITLASVMSTRTDLINKLQENNRALALADQAKNNFLALMSHELRTPMTGVLGMADLLMDTGLNQEQEKYVRTLSRSGQSLLSLLNDILDFSKIEAGRLKIEQTTFVLTEAIADVCCLFAGAATEKGVEIRQVLPAAFCNFVHGDGLRFRQVLSNLVGNAVKFTNHGQVVVGMDQTRDSDGLLTINVSVEDSGIGISPTNIQNLFQPFTQADSSIGRKFGGTGLGLAICRDLVKAMGGEIRVVSTEGIGSIFSFYVRMAPSDETAFNRQVEMGAATGVRGSGRSLVVLVADDNATIRTLMLAMFRRRGHTVVLVEDGAAAVEAVKTQKFDIVLMDMHMPLLDGLGAIRAIREMETKSGQHLPIIMLTADVTAIGQNAARMAGADLVLEKPVRWNSLFQNISSLIEGGAALTRVADSPHVTKRGLGRSLDRSVLDALRQDLGNETADHLLHTFLGHLGDVRDELREAVMSKNLKAVKRVAHKLKGVSRQFGARELGELAGIIEEKSTSLEEAAEILPRVYAIIEELKA